MVKKYPQATFVTAAAFHHVELAEDSKEFELIIPHEDIRKQGYVVNVSPHKTTKVSCYNYNSLSQQTEQAINTSLA